MTREGKINVVFCWLLIIGGFFITQNPILAAAGDVVINEIMTGQTGATKNEFIELYNTTENNIDLSGYKLKKKTKSGTESNLISSSKFIGIIPAGGYFLIAHPDYKDTINADLAYSGSSYSIASNNTIILYDTEDNIVDKVGYGEEVVDFENQAAPDPGSDQSIERQPVGYDSNNNSTDFVIQSTPTPQNSILSQQTIPSTDISSPTNTSSSDFTNHPPFAVAGSSITALTNQEILFDASESYDMNNDPITYFWNFGDGATDIEEETTHTYTYPGQYLVSLLVSDGTFSDLDIITVNIYERSVIINEFSNQWIELYNQSDQMANLTDWQLNDFIFPPNSFIGPKQFLILKQEITKIDFSSSNDQISLIYPDGSVGTKVSYLAEDKEGFSIAFDGDDYFWTRVPTPGLANIISITNIAKEPESFSANNPELIIEQISLTPRDNFISQESPTSSTQFIGATSQTPQNNSQIAAISQSTQSNQKSTLILYLSIIISGSLLISWIIIKVRNSRRV